MALVHHVRKNGAQHPGQTLPGSGDFWAWGDSDLYLARTRSDALQLTVEHRGAPAPPPISLKLAAPDHPADPAVGGPHLQVLSTQARPRRRRWQIASSPSCATIDPPPIAPCAPALRVRDQTLSNALRSLEAAGRLSRTAHGWRLSAPA